MARHSVLMIFNPFHPQETLNISPSNFNVHTKSNLSFKSFSWDCEDLLYEIVNCIKFLRCLQSNSHVILNLVSDFNFSISIINDALTALLLTLKTSVEINSFEFNWITINSPKSENIPNDLIYSWKENFPFINFVHGNFDTNQKNKNNENILVIPNIIQLPVIGSVSCKDIN